MGRPVRNSWRPRPSRVDPDEGSDPMGWAAGRARERTSQGWAVPGGAASWWSEGSQHWGGQGWAWLVFHGDRSLWFNSQAPCPSSHSWGLHRSLLGLVTPCPVLPAGGQPSQGQLPSHTSLLHSLQDAPPSSRKPPPPSRGISGTLSSGRLVSSPSLERLSDTGPEFLASPLLSPNPV